jgi:aspartyl-tRNA(Asn)/glutamyl-tRNA(Gln) amidotransferase subunit C
VKEVQNLKLKNQNEKKLTTDEVKHVARLANLDLSHEEIEKFTAQLSEVIDYNVGLLNQVETESVEPLYQVNDEKNRVREDETAPSLKSEQALKNASSEYNGFFRVDRIIED